MKNKEKKQIPVIGQGINKKAGITIFTLVMLIMGVIIVCYHNPLANQTDELVKKIIACTLIVIAVIAFIKFYDKITQLPFELYQNRRLIWRLAKNDFKRRYAGSYMGAVWAMIQPVVTVAMYYIVFQVIMPQKATLVGEGIEVPYLVFLTAGLVPWFYFSEAIVNGMMALLEYEYLVKKVVFNIRILPVVKVFSAVFVHCFFVVIVLVIYTCMGYPPSLYALQLVYYSFCIFMLILAITYMTSAAVVFFRDLSQIINIMLQVGVWVTPIMWDFNDLGLGGLLANILKLNPVFYIVQGYRDSLINKVAIWEHPVLTLYFWGFTLVVFVLGTRLFKKLQVHFADVL